MGSGQGAILLADKGGSGNLLIEEAHKKAQITNRLLVVRTGDDVINYLKGNGDYADRARWPMPAVVLLDLTLPGLDGFQVLQRIRKCDEFDSVIIVVLAAENQSGNVDRAYQLGANSFLIKPSDLDQSEELYTLLVKFWLDYNVPAGLK